MKLLSVLLFITLSAQAHFKIGLYEGVDSMGQKCTFEFLKKEFSYDAKNPINERVEVSYDGSPFVVLTHPVDLDVDGKITVNKHFLQGAYGSTVLGEFVGAGLVRLYMVHTGDHPGPSHATFTSDNWVMGMNDTQTCKNLVFIK